MSKYTELQHGETSIWKSYFEGLKTLFLALYLVEVVFTCLLLAVELRPKTALNNSRRGFKKRTNFADIS